MEEADRKKTTNQPTKNPKPTIKKNNKLRSDMSQFMLETQLYLNGKASYHGLKVLHWTLSLLSLFVHLPKAGRLR